jgi:hypothetical protein
MDLVAIDPNSIGPIASHPFAVPCGIASTYHFRCRSSVGLSCRCVAWKLQMLESGVKQLPRKEPPAQFEPWTFIRRESTIGKLRQTLIRFGLSHGFYKNVALSPASLESVLLATPPSPAINTMIKDWWDRQIYLNTCPSSLAEDVHRLVR